jgi:hypothetical protein
MNDVLRRRAGTPLTLSGRLGGEDGTLDCGGLPVGSWSGGLCGYLGRSGGGGLLGGLTLDLLRVTVEEEVGEDGPCLGSGEGSTQTENLTAEKVPDLAKARRRRSKFASVSELPGMPNRTRSALTRPME